MCSHYIIFIVYAEMADVKVCNKRACFVFFSCRSNDAPVRSTFYVQQRNLVTKVQFTGEATTYIPIPYL